MTDRKNPARLQTTGEARRRRTARFMGTALLVDDDGSVRRTVGRMLEYFGFAVLQAEDARGAVAITEGHELALAVVDVILKDETGVDVVAALQPRHRDVPVLYISGFPDEVFSRSGLDPSAVNLLPKPFTLKGLGGALDRSLARE